MYQWQHPCMHHKYDKLLYRKSIPQKIGTSTYRPVTTAMREHRSTSNIITCCYLSTTSVTQSNTYCRLTKRGAASTLLMLRRTCISDINISIPRRVSAYIDFQSHFLAFHTHRVSRTDNMAAPIQKYPTLVKSYTQPLSVSVLLFSISTPFIIS